jgi:hypothetical protein
MGLLFEKSNGKMNEKHTDIDLLIGSVNINRNDTQTFQERKIF